MSKPNVVLLLSDDMSWADMGCYGQKKIKTPNLDALCEQGMKFNACYAGAPICAPSRSTLMQGLHMGHATVRQNMKRYRDETYRHCLQSDDVTVAHMFKKAGYATGMFGKWGLALPGQTGLPNDMGFDEFFGYLNQRKAHSYYPEYLWHNKDQVDLPENHGHDHGKLNDFDAQGKALVNGVADPKAASFSFDLCEEASLKFVKANADKLFFMYLPVTIPHSALEVPDLYEYRDLDWPLEMRIYAAMMTHLDRSVGRLIDLFKKLDVYENTLFIFASDNGYSHSSAGSKEMKLSEFFHHAGPYRGKKGNVLMGGLRVPAFAHWPGHVEAGSSSDVPWSFCDFMPTMCELIGQQAPDGIDGISMLPTWLGRGGQAEREFMYWEFDHQQAALMGKWYAYRKKPGESTEIYDANGDPAQERDLAAEMPELVKKAEEIFEREHVQSLFFPDPGEPKEAWWKRLEDAGIELKDNADA